MAAVARVVEAVGVGAYLGAAPLVKDPVLLTAAGSILTVEARHQTILNILSKNGTAIPSAFDIALTPNEVLALASPFIDGPCDLGVKGLWVVFQSAKTRTDEFAYQPTLPLPSPPIGLFALGRSSPSPHLL